MADFDYSDFSFGPDTEIAPMDMALLDNREIRAYQKRVASLKDLKPFMRTSADTLVHKIDRDLWTIQAEGDAFVIQRQFDETGNPLKG